MPDIDRAWREAARVLYGREGLTVPTHGAVHPMADGGAFVEATVWVPSLPVPPVKTPQEAQ